MRLRVLMPFFPLVCLSLCALAAAEDTAPPHVLEVGDRVYEIAEGAPREIETPDGTRLTVTLQPNTPRQFEGHGLTFAYPRAMQVRSTADAEVVTITCEGEHSPRIVIQIYTLGLQPDAVRKTLVDGLSSQIAARGGAVDAGDKKGSVTRTIAGAEREGRRLAAKLGDRAIGAEVFAFNHGDRVLAFLLQYNADEADMAARFFQVVGESLK